MSAPTTGSRWRRFAAAADRDEAGMTLIELLIAMFLLSIVSTLVVTAVSSASRVLVNTDDENRGLQDAKVILDRLSRDVRQARSVVCDGGLADPQDAASTDPTCVAHLQLWIDDDSDYLQDDSEVVTWLLSKNADGEHFDVWRFKGNGLNGNVQQKQLQASALIVRTLFEYNATVPQDADLVTMKMQYDALVGRGVDLRFASVSARLRNKG
jgi:prepilin-type N-terminal cleavage/methylation domain-containing protein